MKDHDFIIISLDPWYGPLSSLSKCVAKELSKNNRVLYINPPLDRKTVMTRKGDTTLKKHLSIVKGNGEDLVEISKNLWNYYPRTILESVNWIPNTKIFSCFNYINNKRFAASILSAIKRLHFKNYILINDKDLFRGYYLKELLNPKIYLYFDRDYILGVDYWRKHGITLEPMLAKKSDLVVSHSDQLISLLKPYNPNIYNVGSGVDVDMFDTSKNYVIPEELLALRSPLIGYAGALTAARLDERAFVKIAENRPEWTMVLVGPEDEVFQRSKLHQMKNVIFCGRKHINEVPAFILAMDVCLNLQVINDITIGNYPLKIDEYLALGKPVVATKTMGMKPFENIVYMAEEGGDYTSLVEKALQENNEQKTGERIKLAKSHSWENVLNNIYQAIEKTMSLKNGTGY